LRENTHNDKNSEIIEEKKSNKGSNEENGIKLVDIDVNVKKVDIPLNSDLNSNIILDTNQKGDPIQKGRVTEP